MNHRVYLSDAAFSFFFETAATDFRTITVISEHLFVYFFSFSTFYVFWLRVVTYVSF